MQRLTILQTLEALTRAINWVQDNPPTDDSFANTILGKAVQFGTGLTWEELCDYHTSNKLYTPLSALLCIDPKEVYGFYGLGPNESNESAKKLLENLHATTR